MKSKFLTAIIGMSITGLASAGTLDQACWDGTFAYNTATAVGKDGRIEFGISGS